MRINHDQEWRYVMKIQKWLINYMVNKVATTELMKYHEIIWEFFFINIQTQLFLWTHERHFLDYEIRVAIFTGQHLFKNKF